MIVVDTNVLVYFFIQNPNTPEVDQVFKRDSHWIAPYLWKSEFRNALTGEIRRRVLSIETAKNITTEAETFMEGREREVTSDHVLSLVSQSDCTAYDCEFVAVAQNLNIPLLTYDKKILKEFPSFSITPKTFISR